MEKIEKPVSLRINPETRGIIDCLIKKTGLKQADIIRLALRRLLEHESRNAPEPVAKPASKKH